MTKVEKEKQIQALKNLGLTDEEVAKVLADDEKIDKGAKLFELPKELEQGAKKARNAGNCKGYTKPKERTKAEDTDKRTLIKAIIEAIEPLTDEKTVCINNAERELEFVRGGKKYKIVLSCPRK